ncbi:hypothetical protein BKK42_23270 [Bacillus cereus]|nr:hypothetical protein BKK43_21150 [Bacillus cereus]ONG78237.1 hypothetical protein BKK42_23270 [Bacillus cereus]
MPGGKFSKTVGAFSAFDVYSNVQAGDDIGTAVVKSGAQQIYWTMAPTLAFATTFAPMIGEGAMALGKWQHGKQQWWNQQFQHNGVVGGNYIDTQRALTMRQASVQAIQGSKMNARSALGDEARILSPYGAYR